MSRTGSWLVRVFGVCALGVLCGSAKAESTSVKDTTLLSARAALSHYDLRPTGTTTQLAALGRYAREHAGERESDEAKFLQAAVASDLWFVAEITEDPQLKAAILGSLGVEESALQEHLARALRECAHGVYLQAAEQALAAIQGSTDAVDRATHDTRSDTLLLRSAANKLAGEASLGELAALGRDPCAAAGCAPAYADLDARARRAVWYLEQVYAADQRLQSAAKNGDPLADALLPSVAVLRGKLQSRRVQLSMHITPELSANTPDTHGKLPLLDALFFMRGMDVLYAQLPSAQLGDQGVTRVDAEHAPPKLQALVTLKDAVPYARPIDELVTQAKQLRNGAAQWTVGMAVTPGTPTLLWARALVSLVKAGASRIFVVGRGEHDALTSVQVHLVQMGYAEPVPNTELKLRVRLGGYTVKLPDVTQDIPRYQDDTGYHFDQAGLVRALSPRKLRTAAVSYMGDVAVEQLIWALFSVPSLPQPLELIIQ
jgi:hypothetical protein